MPDAETQSQGDQGTSQGDDEKFDEDRAMKTIKAQRESEAAAKAAAKEASAERDAIAVKLDELQTKLDAADDAKLSDQEKLTKKIAELEAKQADVETASRVRVAKQAVKASAAALGAHYPDDVPALVDLAAVKFDKDGDPKNADDLVAALKESRPALFGEKKPGSAEGGPRGQRPSSKPGMDDLLRSAAGR